VAALRLSQRQVKEDASSAFGAIDEDGPALTPRDDAGISLIPSAPDSPFGQRSSAAQSVIGGPAGSTSTPWSVGALGLAAGGPIRDRKSTSAVHAPTLVGLGTGVPAPRSMGGRDRRLGNRSEDFATSASGAVTATIRYLHVGSYTFRLESAEDQERWEEFIQYGKNRGGAPSSAVDL